ncbi:biotin/lipoyl-binding protein [Chloroflexi bacterium TSY]|nr:biotin/lipoyl-binding protein [Chloroflexi bacterium TSY]
MKYFAQVGETEYEVTIDKEQILVNGEPIQIDLQQGGVSELYSLLFGGVSYEVLIESDRMNYAVTLRGEQFQITVEDEQTRKLNMGRKAPSSPSGERSLSAPIPGLVVKVLVEEGVEVEEDQPLIILEAMKMENEIRAQGKGTVKKINVTAGQRVEQNSVLILLE